jgi:inner membrane protein
MSSFIGHFVTGASLYLAKQELNSYRSALLCGMTSFLAMSPDIDYLIFWMSDINIEPRVTHSLGFCLGIAILAWLVIRTNRIQKLGAISPRIIIAAPISHLILDFFVGIHPMPLFWPISNESFRIPYGLLPSAGRLDISNHYLWRNLIIELGILLPLLTAIVLVGRGRARQILTPIAAFGWLIFSVSLAYSITLHRSP